MYIIAVSEMITETMMPKKVARLPSAMRKTSTTKTEPMIAERMFMVSGVPCLLNLPNHRGAAPSRPATAWMRTPPCCHTPPALMMVRMISAQMNQLNAVLGAAEHAGHGVVGVGEAGRRSRARRRSGRAARRGSSSR